MWTWSAVVLPILTMASVMAAVISRFCWGVRPAYHWTVMLGMGSPLLESRHVLGKVGREGIGLDPAVAVEADREILRPFRAQAAPAVEPAPRRVSAVDPDLVRLAEDAHKLGLVGFAQGDPAGFRRGEVAAVRRRHAPCRERGGKERNQGEDETHDLIITRAVRRGQRQAADKGPSATPTQLQFGAPSAAGST